MLKRLLYTEEASQDIIKAHVNGAVRIIDGVLLCCVDIESDAYECCCSRAYGARCERL